jgi:two-component system response regulator FlrC
MRQHPWPGNVRELENVIQRALLMADTDHITSDDLGLPANIGHPAADTAALTNAQINVQEPGAAPYVQANAYGGGRSGGDLGGHSGGYLGDRSATTPVAAAKEDAVDMRSIEREHILQVLRTVNGSRRRAVELLGISERALRYKLKSYREDGHVVS